MPRDLIEVVVTRTVTVEPDVAQQLGEDLLEYLDQQGYEVTHKIRRVSDDASYEDLVKSFIDWRVGMAIIGGS